MKVPKEAKRVFEGVIFDVYQWQQKMYDGSFATYERLKMLDVVQVLPVTSEGKILISHEEQPAKPLGYTFFGGHQEKGEDALVAVQRELLEETGYQSNDYYLYGQYEHLYLADSTMSFYIARNCVKVGLPSLDSGEKIDIIEANFDEFLEIIKRADFINKLLASEILKLESDPLKLAEFKQLLFKNN